MSGDDDVLAVGAPAFPTEDVLGLLRDGYGWTVTEARPLDSERDQMFAVGDAVLKISNVAERADVLDMEVRAMRHLAELDPALPVPREIPTRAGEAVGSIVDSQGRRHLVRLISALPGRHAEGRPVSLTFASNVGDACARVGVGLQGFFHPAAGRYVGWDIRVARPPVDGDDRLSEAKRRIAPALAATRALPSGVQHADLTLTNVLREESDDITGIIDFGDMHHTAAACDLAVSLTSLLRSTGEAEGSPWELAAAFLDGYQRRRPLQPAEARLLGHLVLARVVTTLDISRERAGDHPANRAYITRYDEGRRALLELLTDLTDEDLSRRFAQLAGLAGWPAGTDLAHRRSAVLGGRLAPRFYAEPLRIERGEDAWLIDADGNRYLDAYNNVAVAGHTQPAVTEAVVHQLRTLNTHSRYLHPHIVTLAERLTATMPAGLDTCVFVTSGSEAVELAWRLACAYTGSTGTIVAEWAYHGVSARTHDFSPNDWSREFAVPDVATFRAPHDEPSLRGGLRPPSRSPQTQHEDGPPLDHQEAFQRVLAAAGQLRSRGFAPAVLMVDPQFTSEGILDAPDGFMSGLLAGTHTVGGLLLADEVQSGFGRSGPALWRFAAHGITPDLVTLGKPMGAGLPVAAVVTRREIADAFARDHEYFSTFAGSPVAGAAALAVLDVLADRNIPERAVRVGEYLRRRISELAAIFPVIWAVRGYGLIAGIDLREGRYGGGRAFTTAVVEGLREQRVLAGRTGRRGDVLKVRPPLSWTERHTDHFVAALHTVLASL